MTTEGIDHAMIVRASTLRECFTRIKSLDDSSGSTLSDFLLGTAMLLFGIALSSFLSGLSNTNHELWWLFMLLIPLLSVGIGGSVLVAYFYTRASECKAVRDRAIEAVSILPDPTSEYSDQSTINAVLGDWNLYSETTHSGKKASGFVQFRTGRGHLIGAGHMKGASKQLIGTFTTLFCDYEERTRRLLAVYTVSTRDDDGRVFSRDCVISGVLMDPINSGKYWIQGHWNSLSGEQDAGTIMLEKVTAESANDCETARVNN